MSRFDAAAAMDRLPWLPDEPKPQRAKRRGGAVLGWAAATIVAVAGAAFWIGVTSVREQPTALVPRTQPTTTATLPEARPAMPEVRLPSQAPIRPVAVPEVRPSPTREVKIALPRAQTQAAGEAEKSSPAPESVAQSSTAPPSASPVVPEAKPFVLPKPWNPRIFAGAAGRIVQIGAFGSTPQAKRGWWFMVRAYPAVAHLPAVVRVTRNSKGQPFYRFQIGTTSQAHSEVLCQRMQRIRFSCAVVGLPWKAKVER
jgi:hypothetical protein